VFRLVGICADGAAVNLCARGAEEGLPGPFYAGQRWVGRRTIECRERKAAVTAITWRQDLLGFKRVTKQVTFEAQDVESGQVFVGKIEPETLIEAGYLVVTIPFESEGDPPEILVGDADDTSRYVGAGDADASAVGVYQQEERMARFYPDQQRLYVTIQAAAEGRLTAGACHAVFSCVSLDGMVS